MKGVTNNSLLLVLCLIFCSNISFAPSQMHCVFIHGLNPYSVPTENDKSVYFYNSENINTLITPIASYWGEEVKKWTQDGDRPCTTYGFTYLDTMSKGYEDKGNSTAVCQALNYENEVNTQTNRKVFLHSMGNLIFYNALANDDCKIVKDKTKVYSLAGPFGGAPIIKPLDEICSKIHEISTNPVVQKVKSTVSGFFEFLDNKCGITIFHSLAQGCGLVFSYEKSKFETIERFCTDGKASPGPQSCYKINNTTLINTANNFSSGAICGFTDGDGGKFDLYELLNWLTDYYDVSSPDPEMNDGVVPTTSCTAVQSKRYESSPTNTNDYWIVPYNHSDITGATDQLQIITWLTSRK